MLFHHLSLLRHVVDVFIVFFNWLVYNLPFYSRYWDVLNLMLNFYIVSVSSLNRDKLSKLLRNILNCWFFNWDVFTPLLHWIPHSELMVILRWLKLRYLRLGLNFLFCISRVIWPILASWFFIDHRLKSVK